MTVSLVRDVRIKAENVLKCGVLYYSAGPTDTLTLTVILTLSLTIIQS